MRVTILSGAFVLAAAAASAQTAQVVPPEPGTAGRSAPPAGSAAARPAPATSGPVGPGATGLGPTGAAPPGAGTAGAAATGPAKPAGGLQRPVLKPENEKSREEAEARQKRWDDRMRRATRSMCVGC